NGVGGCACLGALSCETTTTTTSTTTTLPPCGDELLPACNGDCPTGSLCLAFSNGGPLEGCHCFVGGILPCANAQAPACNGECGGGAACLDLGGFCGCV